MSSFPAMERSEVSRISYDGRKLSDLVFSLNFLGKLCLIGFLVWAELPGFASFFAVWHFFEFRYHRTEGATRLHVELFGLSYNYNSCVQAEEDDDEE